MKLDPVRAFGREIRLRRIALGMTIEMLGQQAGVSPGSIGMIEMGRRKRGPSLDVAVRIATALGTDIPDLFGGFHGLTPEGIDAARVIEALPPDTRSALVTFLRTNASEKKRR